MQAGLGENGAPNRAHAHCVGLAFDAAAAGTHEGRCVIDLSLRLLVREWPCVAIVDLTGRHGSFADSLAALARSINPHVRLAEVPEVGIPTLVAGSTAIGEGPAFYVGSRGWVARFSPERPVGSGATTNPFGASVAACLGVANAFRVACSSGQGGPLTSFVDDNIELSTFDYSRGPTAVNPNLPSVDLGTTHLVGLDGIGAAAIWALARIGGLEGTLHLIDERTVELASLRRHVLATRADIGVARVDVGAAALRATALEVCVHPVSWAAYVAELTDWILPRVAVAAGSAPERASIQASLPRVVLNSWTQREDIVVSRHADFLRAPCLACLYWPRETEASTAHVVATGIGLADAEPEIQDMLYDARPVDLPLVERVAAAKHVQVASLLPFAGATVDVFYHRAVEAGVIEATDAAGRAASSETAFQAALAGVLLAAEIVIDAAVPRSPMPTLTRINPMRRLAERLAVPAARDPNGMCICGDADFREIYARKYLT